MQIMAHNKFNISRNGCKLGEYELLKRCSMSSGYDVYLFCDKSNARLSRYIVAVKQGDTTVEFHSLLPAGKPFSMYLDLICCYA